MALFPACMHTYAGCAVAVENGVLPHDSSSARPSPLGLCLHESELTDFTLPVNALISSYLQRTYCEKAVNIIVNFEILLKRYNTVGTTVYKTAVSVLELSTNRLGRALMINGL